MKSPDQYLILVVDDNQMNVLLATRHLENHGFRVVSAESGMAGMERMKEQLPDLVLLDIMMPEMDGYEVCRRIKQVSEWKEIPVIFLTANYHTENVIEGFESGGVDYITKPYKSEELIVRVVNHLELADSKKTIIEMSQTRDKMYSIIAHDIRSPLSGIQQTISAIDQGFFDPQSEDFKDIIHHLNERTKETSTLLTSLLQWTRMQGTTIELEKTNVDLCQLVQSCVNLLQANATDKKISILNDVHANVKAWCDDVSIHTVIRNLISNAIKFTPENGTIRLLSSENDQTASITVKDSGVGMAAETIEKIFANNQSYTSSGTANEQGTGLGLMMVKDFVSRNLGNIDVKSVVGEGTEITISLPKTETWV